MARRCVNTPGQVNDIAEPSMSDDIADREKCNPVPKTFNRQPITLVEWRGKPVVIAREVGAGLGYARAGKNLVDLLAGEWRDDFIEGVDYELLKNGVLAEFKAEHHEAGITRLVGPRVNSLILLTEQGLHMVLVKTDKPAGRAMRRWVVDELIPSWRARHTPANQPPPPDDPPPAAPAQARPRAPELPPQSPPPRRVFRSSPPPLDSPAAVMLHALHNLHRAKQLPDACYHALKIIVEMLDRQPAGSPPPPQSPPPREAHPLPRSPRRLRLTGPVESEGEARERLIAEAMRATNPQGTQAGGVWFDTVANNLYYSATHQADYDAGRIDARMYTYLLLQVVRGWAEWRVATGDLDLLGLLHEVRDAVERFCGPVPGLA